MRIMIAEDDAASLLVLEAAVEKLGHQCFTATDGGEAWALLQHTPVDVVISDRMMPGLNGLELCRRVRALARPEYTYFMFLTGVREKLQIFEGMQSGADDYLLKPLNYEELQLRLIVAARITSLHAKLTEKTHELERLNNEFAEQGRTDTLTGLGNRLRLHEDLDALAGRARRYGQRCCIAMCDVDHFKVYNDTHGHVAGDEVLRRVSRTIRETARSEDGVYRYGGEEFLVMLPEQSLESAVVAMDRIRKAIERLAIPLDPGPPGRLVTISSGVADLDVSAGEKVEQLIERADSALYRAKRSGRNNVQAAPRHER